MDPVLEAQVCSALRKAGAQFAFAFGSRVSAQPTAASDYDVAGWWGNDPPDPWDVHLPSRVDLVVLDSAPLWLAGRVALQGRLLFDDDPPARVAWQADTRLIYLDEIPGIRRRQQEWLRVVSSG